MRATNWGGATIKEPYSEAPFLMNPGSTGCSLFMSPESEVVPILNVVGEVDLSNAPRIYSLIWQTSRKGSQSLILNLEKLDFMDSSGLQVLLRLREKLKSKKQDIFLVAPKPQIHKLLKLTGFDKLFALYATNEEAKLLLQADETMKPPGPGETSI